MSFLLKYLLIGHIFIGLTGIILFYAVLMVLLKTIDDKRIKLLRRLSLWGFISFVLSWISGGYYYVQYYGDKVKPIIKAGNYPWAHTIIMEAKEHIFLFLPFAALAITLLFYFLGDKIEQNQNIKKSAILLSVIIVIIGTLMALMGIMISGAVK